MYAEQFQKNISPTEQESSTKLIAEQIKQYMPNVKLFMFVTDPVDRMFSHIKDCSKINRIPYDS